MQIMKPVTSETSTANQPINNNNANSVSHYKLITIGLIIGLVGVFMRFAGTCNLLDIISNVLFAVGSIICIKAVLNILK